MKLWKDLQATEEEQKLIEKLVNGGAGKTLSKEELNCYQVKKEWDLEIDTAAGKTLVHMYDPEPGNRKKPLLIDIHGGGFIKGRRDQDIVLCRSYASRTGYLVADIDYVPAPAMRYPGQVYACYEVLQYLAEHAEELDVDRDRIVVMGHSVGGNLTAAIALMAIDKGGFLPAMQIMNYASLDMATPVEQKRNGDANPKLPAVICNFFAKMYTEPELAKVPYCSPVFATDTQLRQMPPTLMTYCDNDMFCDEDEAFANRLQSLGVPVAAKRFFYSGHGFLVQRRDEYEVAEKMIFGALKALNEEK